MKTTTLKKLFTFILLMSGMFSSSFSNAQSCPYCNESQGKVRMFKCTNASNGVCTKWKNKCVSANQVQNFLSQGYSYGYIHCGGNGRLANQSAGNEFSTLNYSNPVSTSTTISFYVNERENIAIRIFDVNGRLVTTLADKIFEEGENELTWNAEDVEAGIYFLRMETANYSENRKLIVTK